MRITPFLIHQHRCEDAEAFEVQDGGKSTGIFTKYLNAHILQPEKVTHVLERVSEGEYHKRGRGFGFWAHADKCVCLIWCDVIIVVHISHAALFIKGEVVDHVVLCIKMKSFACEIKSTLR